VLRLGKINRVLEPGFHIKYPFAEDLVQFSIRTQKVSYEGVDAYTRDNQVVTSTLLIAYHLDPAQLERIYRQYGRDFEQRLMRELAIGTFRSVMGDVNTIMLASERAEVATIAQNRLQELLAPYGAIVDDAKLYDLKYSDSFEEKIERAALEKAEVERAEQVRRRTEKEAEARIIEAQGEAQARRERADANYYELQQQGLGEAEKIRAIGDAEAERLKARAEVIRQNPELVALIRAEAALNWDGKLPERMFPTTALPLLQLDSAN
jgi:regulator of protease activity HflC (stomatin/prohibitin superfamily)